MEQKQERERLLHLRSQSVKNKDWKEAKRMNRRIMEEDQQSQRETVDYFPPRLQIEHSNICNAQCIMCSHFFTQNARPRFAGQSFREIIRPLLPYAEKITLHGVGEPLAHPQIAEFIEWYHSYAIRVTCNTNMSYMDCRLAEAIRKAFSTITISCDGCTPKTYEGIRKGLSFEEFKENTRLLRSHAPALKIRMHTVAMRQNLAELPGIVRLAAELGCCHITIVDLTPQEFLDNQKDAPTHYIATLQAYLGQAIEEAAKCGISIAYPQILMKATGRPFGQEQQEMARYPLFPTDEFQNQLKEAYKDLHLDGNTIPATLACFAIPSSYRCQGVCDYFAEEPYIDINGDVFLCCANWLHSLGNLNDSSFEAIWNGKLYQTLRKLFAEGQLPKYCKGCIFLRNQMFTSKIKIERLDKAFWMSEFDQEVAKIMNAKRS